MKRLLGFVKKEFLHIMRDKRTLFIMLGMPVVQILLFGYAITNEIRNANIAILDLSKDRVTEELTNKILSSGYFKLYAYLNNIKQIEEAFKSGKVKQVIVFEEKFAETLTKENRASVQILVDATDPNTGNTLLFYTNSIMQDYTNQINQPQMPQLTIIPEIKLMYNPEMKGVYLFVPGIITVLLMLISAMMTSISITREKEYGSMEVLLASPMKPALVIIAKVIPYLILSTVITLIILALGHFVFEVPILGSIFLLLAECTLFNLTVLSLGVFISSRTSSQQVALMISLVGLMLPTILLSGFIYPIENMPWPLQIIGNLNPATWFIIILKDIMLKGSSFDIIWKPTLIIAAFTLLFIGLSIKNYKIRL